jgi:hypothetical protein
VRYNSDKVNLKDDHCTYSTHELDGGDLEDKCFNESGLAGRATSSAIYQ